ncbi:MAG: beta-ketoacyl-ACP synthase III [Lachnospiraceae bacterium]
MQGLQITATGRALPEKIVSNDDMSRLVDTSDEWIRTRTGIAQRYVCDEENCTSLAIAAGQQAISRSGIKPSEVAAVVVATSTADYAFPSAACFVQKALGLPRDVMAFDLSAACSGFLYGLGVCRGLLMNSQKQYALLIGSEQMSRITDYTDRSTCVLFGDGAGAAVVTLSNQPFYYRAWSDGAKEALYCPGVGQESSCISMEGNQVFRFAVKAIAEGIEQILKDAQMSMDEIDYVVCHQANRRIIEHVKKKYKGCRTEFYMNMEQYANTSAASIPIALDEMFEKGLLKAGMHIICVGFGAGFTWSSTLLTI